jgi:hypothetical protein
MKFIISNVCFFMIWGEGNFLQHFKYLDHVASNKHNYCVINLEVVVAQMRHYAAFTWIN